MIIEDEYLGERLDRFIVAKIPGYSRGYFQKLIKNGSVTYNGNPCPDPDFRIKPGILEITFSEEKPREILPEKIELDVIYEDKSFLVINKAPGIVVHPAAGNWSGTIVNALAGRGKFFKEKAAGNLRPGIVHRLDKDTSGCLIVAKNSSAHFKLTRLFSARKVEKTYAAITYGVPIKDTERIVTLIGRHPIDRKKMSIVEKNGREAITIYEVVKSGIVDDVSLALLDIKILTGRTHQIRVHLASRKIPVLGDTVYGGHQDFPAPRQMLHAWKISFPHPESDKLIELESPLPCDFQEICDRF
ncbi:MAG: hypothetical protein A2020_07755 [Lentisphaerae bacterium GWF2_45_14]|nr:MAG: hypothetical protein A2020_07755 [Lentisphaerae bacterium GWF2_45_14]